MFALRSTTTKLAAASLAAVGIAASGLAVTTTTASAHRVTSAPSVSGYRTIASCQSNVPMGQGSRGACVSALQRGLNVCDKAALRVDGAFGPNTARALRSYNTRYGMSGATTNWTVWANLKGCYAG